MTNTFSVAKKDTLTTSQKLLDFFLNFSQHESTYYWLVRIVKEKYTWFVRLIHLTVLLAFAKIYHAKSEETWKIQSQYTADKYYAISVRLTFLTQENHLVLGSTNRRTVCVIRLTSAIKISVSLLQHFPFHKWLRRQYVFRTELFPPARVSVTKCTLDQAPCFWITPLYMNKIWM